MIPQTNDIIRGISPPLRNKPVCSGRFMKSRNVGLHRELKSNGIGHDLTEIDMTYKMSFFPRDRLREDPRTKCF